MADGWVSVHRTLQDHWLWEDKPFSKGQAWIDLLMLANHEDSKFLLGNQLVEAKRGDVITSEVKLMDRWGWSNTKVRNFITLLEKDSMIIKKTDSKKSVLTLTNYSVWQDSKSEKKVKKKCDKSALEVEGKCDKSAIKVQEHTINNSNNSNNSNNVNNSNKDIYVDHKFKPPTLDEVKRYCLERKNNVDAEKWHNFYSSKGWMVGKNKMKDWRAAVRTWERGDKQQATPRVDKDFVPKRSIQDDVTAQWLAMHEEAERNGQS